MHIYRSFSSRATKAIAGRIGKEIVSSFRASARRDALVVALIGDLGAGKTTFVQGFLSALRVRENITSPTFVLLKRYALSGVPFAHLYHIDAYRLKNAKDLVALHYKEMLRDPGAIVLIEWADRVPRAIPKHSVRITLLHGAKEHERVIKIRGAMGR